MGWKIKDYCIIVRMNELQTYENMTVNFMYQLRLGYVAHDCFIKHYARCYCEGVLQV